MGFSGMSNNLCSLSTGWSASPIRACTWAQWSPWKPPELSFSASLLLRGSGLPKLDRATLFLEETFQPPELEENKAGGFKWSLGTGSLSGSQCLHL